ncbi:hypothetical protein ASE48_13335 [Mycobacterium sp. Root265]|uniref:hypothetical protein n=1 Tax=Mycobacterium sp. Root265 TaxID=1736504 RepID=UPI000710B927|nr:hypothetical protein [Mycobacterium sp. Root265]KRD06920.1 hypothetical protein ASE48_13335 [Mycobacterium sp. Root265]
MGAAREEFLRRSMVAGVATTVVMSLTALTAGVAPAVADPEIVATTTAEAPQQSGGSGGGEGRGGGRGGQQESPYVEPAVTPEAPAQTQAPVATQAPATQAPATQAPAVAQEPVVTQAPVGAPRVTVAPETVAPKPEPKPEPTPEPKPQPAVEQPTTTSTKRPSTQVTTSPAAPSAEPEPSTTAPSTGTSEPKPVEQEALNTSPSGAAPRSGEATPSDRPTTESSAAAEPSETEASATQAPETEATESEAMDTESSAADEPQVENAAKVIETLKPEVLDAPVADVQLASSAKPVEVNPEPAKLEELAQLSSLVGVSNERDRLEEERRQLREDQRELREDQRELRAEQRDWDNRVRQWSPDWVQYDEFYRPMIVNPYRDPVRIVYEYENRPRVVTIPPLQRMVMYVADLAAYSFTAVVLNTINTVVSTAVGVAVGSFFGGGFIPNIANIANFTPPPPPPLFRYDNVPVQVRYSDAVYEPFRVQRIVDVGDDARYGERRVLLDGVTPAWGVWKQNAVGERQFEVHRTQQYPGLDTPREGPLPGDYRMTLASDEVPASTGGGQTTLIIAAVACAVLSLGAVGAAALMGRRRRV